MRLLFCIAAILAAALGTLHGADFLYAEETALTGTSGAPETIDLDYAQVVFVKAVQEEGIWRFDVTIRHNDEGWGHYADLFQLVDPKSGSVIAERVLVHPHETEQPFTRSLGNIKIPSETSELIVRARCTIHGFGGRAVLVNLKEPDGEYFQVFRK